MERKMDISNLKGFEIWTQSLGLLFNACEPLINDCDYTEEERNDLLMNIERHIHYCREVKRDVEHGRSPKTWDKWNEERDRFKVEGLAPSLVSVDTQDFGDVFTEIFGSSKGDRHDVK